MYHPYLVGDKLYLRGIEKEDLSGPFFQWMNDEVVTRYLIMGSRPNILQNLEDWFEELRKKEDEIVFMIMSKSNYEIGYCGLYHVSWISRNAEYRIFIGETDFWNQGYGAEATDLVVSYAFEKLNLNKVWLGVTSENKRATKLYQKCGFKNEGILRQEVYRNGKYYDAIRMSILRAEYSGVR